MTTEVFSNVRLRRQEAKRASTFRDAHSVPLHPARLDADHVRQHRPVSERRAPCFVDRCTLQQCLANHILKIAVELMKGQKSRVVRQKILQ